MPQDPEVLARVVRALWPLIPARQRRRVLADLWWELRSGEYDAVVTLLTGP